MNPAEKTLTPRLIKRLWLAFIMIILLMGVSYIFITVYFANRYNLATAQRVNAAIAGNLIEEKFKDTSPFLPDGRPNQALFGELMHDMMAVNRSIEVYLLGKSGEILYSVVLEPSENASVPKVSLGPVRSFISEKGQAFILGDDPRNPGEKKIFSAAPFHIQGREGYIYIILAGKEFQTISDNLMGQYYIKLGLGATVLTMLFATIIALLSIWFITKNLRLITRTVRRFREGDLTARIADPEKSDIQAFAYSFNEMADTIVGNIDEMKSVDVLRREVIANVSHDLKTPLAVMKGYIETLQIKEESLSRREKQEYLQITHDNIDKLAKLIDQLFEYSKLEAEQVHPVREPFSITELSYDLVAKFNVIASLKRISLELRNPGENIMVYADLGMVERALQNLIENAIKFTGANGRVSLSLDRQMGKIGITVTDTGAGIPVQEQPFIFDRYRQGGKTVDHQGSGLGLAIVKRIMDLHETAITVESQPNEGSSFRFHLPAYP